MAPDDEPRRTAFSVSPELAAWTAHLREHGLTHDAHNDSHKEAWDAHMREHAAEQRAVDKVEVATQARFAAVNEFREQLREQARSFIVRGEYDAMVGRLSAVEQWRAAEGGKDRGAAPYTSVIYSVATAVITAVVVGAIALTRGTP